MTAREPLKVIVARGEVTVFVDGVEQHGVIFADVSAGVVLRIGGDQLGTERVIGTVSVLSRERP